MPGSDPAIPTSRIERRSTVSVLRITVASLCRVASIVLSCSTVCAGVAGGHERDIARVIIAMIN